MLFAMEEGSSFWNVRVLFRAFICSASAALTLNLFIVPLRTALPLGSLGSLGALTFGSYLETDRNSYRTWEMPIFILLGIVGGLIGACFNGLNILITRARMRYVGPRGVKRFLEVLIVTATISGCAFIVPLYTGNCLVPSVHTNHTVNSTPASASWISCEPRSPDSTASFAATVGLFTTPSEDSIKVLFHSPLNFHNGMLAVFIVLYFFAADWTYGLGVPSGLFVPSLLTGAALGRLCGQLLEEHVGGVSHPGTYALVGASAVLAGMARITISLAVILMEATGNTQWSLPVLFTVSASKWTGDFFNKGIYDIHINLKHVPLLEAFAEHAMKRLRVRDVMVRDVRTLPQSISVGALVEHLSSCNHNGFPVVRPDTNQFCGLVQRGMLQHILKHGRSYGAFSRDEQEAGMPAPMVPYAEVASQQPHFPSLNELREVLHPEDYDTFVDIMPYVDTTVLSVQEHATLRRAFVLFRTLGLRHLPVVSSDGSLCGLLTRKELILSPPTESAPSEPVVTAGTPLSAAIGPQTPPLRRQTERGMEPT